MSYLAYIHNSGYLLAVCIIPAILGTYYVHRNISEKEEGLIIIQTTVLAFSFFLLLSEAAGMLINRQSSVFCETREATIIEYQPHFVSAYGRMSSEAGPNRYAITIQYEDQKTEDYVLKNNWFNRTPEGMSFEFKICKSIFGLPMITSLTDGDNEVRLY